MHSSGQCSPRCFNSRTLGRVRLVNSRRIDRAITFQFTHPGKGATRALLRQALFYPVSIHAPWEGCDKPVPFIPRSEEAFQFTHPGKGATAQASSTNHPRRRFNSRTLGRVRLRDEIRNIRLNKVSIHAPWEGCDSPAGRPTQRIRGFNSRTLGRVRRVRPRRRPHRRAVSIHAPWEGCDEAGSDDD